MQAELKFNLKELQAQGGEWYVFSDADSLFANSDRAYLLRLPEYHGALSPVLKVVPLQFLSYRAALANVTDVYKPRILAESVTVE